MIWYRVEDRCEAAPLDQFENSMGEPIVRVVVLQYAVVKETQHGVWIRQHGVWISMYAGLVSPKFVLRGAKKRFACPTLKEAFESFYARKKKQQLILGKQIERVREAIELGRGLEFQALGKEPE